MKTVNQFFKVTILISSAHFMIGCGNGSSASYNANSTYSGPVTYSNGTTKPLATCNQGAGTEITLNLKAYTDSSAKYRMDYVYAKISAIPTSFKTDYSYISFWKWMANSSGSTTIDNSPLEFSLIHSSTGQTLLQNKTTVSWNDLVVIASGMGISDPQNFFKQVNILINLKDANGEYDVLKIVRYNASTNKAISQLDTLLPLFYASPSDYAFETTGAVRANVLQNLHPFKANTTQGYTSAQFQSMANNYCF